MARPRLYLVLRTNGLPSITVAKQLRQTVRRILRQRERDHELELIELDPSMVRAALSDYDERLQEHVERHG